MFYLTKKNLPFLRLGSLLFGTGGGLPYQEHGRFFNSALAVKNRLPVKKITEFTPADYLVSAYGVGDPSLIPAGFQETVIKGIKEYEKLTGYQVKGLIPGEIGAEGLAFLIAATLNRSVVDSDLVGGRAAPEINLDCFSVFDLPITPLLGLTVTGKKIFLTQKISAVKAEKIFRPFFQKNGGSGLLIGYPIKAGEYAKVGIADTISATIKAGRLLKAKKLNQLLKVFSGKLIQEAKITAVQFKNGSGFLEGRIRFKELTVGVKNENLNLYQGQKLITKAPTLICLLNKNIIPIHNADLKRYLGQSVKIVTFPALGYWRKKINQKRWGN